LFKSKGSFDLTMMMMMMISGDTDKIGVLGVENPYHRGGSGGGRHTINVLTEKPGEGGGVWDLPQIILKSR
jgi:hypothetical protein